MKNLLLEDVEYKIEKTRLGIWRRYMYPSGAYFAEFQSYREVMGLSLIHYTRGICPDTGRRIIARGVIAVGRLAAGIIGIGQLATGCITIGQLAFGKYVLAQIGFGDHVWSQKYVDSEAVAFFKQLVGRLIQLR